jgi:phosphatidylglycerophosphate synthase
MRVFWFVPNLVGKRYRIHDTIVLTAAGYTRIILAAWACWTMSTQPHLTVALYGLSCLLDAVDGHLARLLNQCTPTSFVC